MIVVTKKLLLFLHYFDLQLDFQKINPYVEISNDIRYFLFRYIILKNYQRIEFFQYINLKHFLRILIIVIKTGPVIKQDEESVFGSTGQPSIWSVRPSIVHYFSLMSIHLPL